MFRLGTTSYIIPADILPNVDFLAGQVTDIQLLLFESDADGSNLPDAPLRRVLRERAARHALTYTVHLPLDLRLGERGAVGDRSLVVARRVIESTLELEPSGYTLHLDGRRLPPPWGTCTEDALALDDWQAEAERVLHLAASWVGEPARLCVENLEKWDPAAFEPVLARAGVSRTVDIGHVWLEGRDPLPLLDRWLPRARIVHLHGVGERDHQSLRHVPPADLAVVLRVLRERFGGILTLEVFNERDFLESRALIMNGEMAV